jgi:hypothetical protein
MTAAYKLMILKSYIRDHRENKKLALSHKIKTCPVQT